MEKVETGETSLQVEGFEKTESSDGNFQLDDASHSDSKHSSLETTLKYECGICWKEFTDPTCLENHIKEHNVEIHRCDTCGSVFERLDEFNEHVAKHSLDDISPPNTVKSVENDNKDDPDEIEEKPDTVRNEEPAVDENQMDDPVSESVSTETQPLCEATSAETTPKLTGQVDWLSCDICNAQVQGKANLKTHFQLQHAEFEPSVLLMSGLKAKRSPWSTCQKCGEKLRGRRKFSAHVCPLAEDIKNGVHYMDETVRSLRRRYVPRSFVRKKSRTRTFSFRSSASRKNSISTDGTGTKHFKNGPWYTCVTCGKLLRGKLSLMLHKDLAHPDLIKSEKVSPDQKNPEGVNQNTTNSENTVASGIPGIEMLSANSADSETTIQETVDQEKASTKLSSQDTVAMETEDVNGKFPLKEANTDGTKPHWRKCCSHKNCSIYICRKCQKKVRGRQNLNDHMISNHGDDPLTIIPRKSLNFPIAKKTLHYQRFSMKTPTSLLNQNTMQCPRSSMETGMMKDGSSYNRSSHEPLVRERIPKRYTSMSKTSKLMPPDFPWTRTSDKPKCAWYVCGRCDITISGIKRLQAHSFVCQGKRSGVGNGAAPFTAMKIRHSLPTSTKGDNLEPGGDNLCKDTSNVEKITSESGDMNISQSSEQPEDEEKTKKKDRKETYPENNCDAEVDFIQCGTWYVCTLCNEQIRGIQALKSHHCKNSKVRKSPYASINEMKMKLAMNRKRNSDFGWHIAKRSKSNYGDCLLQNENQPNQEFDDSKQTVELEPDAAENLIGRNQNEEENNRRETESVIDEHGPVQNDNDNRQDEKESEFDQSGSETGPDQEIMKSPNNPSQVNRKVQNSKVKTTTSTSVNPTMTLTSHSPSGTDSSVSLKSKDLNTPSRKSKDLNTPSLKSKDLNAQRRFKSKDSRSSKHSSNTFSKQDVFMCNMCQFQCSNEDNMMAHIKGHMGQLKCNNCDFSASSLSALEQHKLEKHKFVTSTVTPMSLLVETYVTKRGRIYSCDICSTRFTKKLSIFAHVEEHLRSSSRKMKDRETGNTMESDDTATNKSMESVVTATNRSSSSGMTENNTIYIKSDDEENTPSITRGSETIFNDTSSLGIVRGVVSKNHTSSCHFFRENRQHDSRIHSNDSVYGHCSLSSSSNSCTPTKAVPGSKRRQTPGFKDTDGLTLSTRNLNSRRVSDPSVMLGGCAESPIGGKNQEMIFMCQKCSFFFAERRNLETHVLMKKHYVCNFCGRLFLSQADLDTHVNMVKETQNCHST